MQNYNSKFQNPQVREGSYNGFSNKAMSPQGRALKMNISDVTEMVQENPFC